MKTFAVGVDLGGTNIRAGLADSNGQIGLRLECETQAAKGPEVVAHKIADLVQQLVAQGSKEAKIFGVGIGSPGPLSREKKMIFQTPNLPGFENFPLGKRVEELCKLPVCLDNDGNCAALGEHMFGVAQGLSDFLILTIGTGIGGGIFANNELIHGKSDGAAETGHICLYPNGRECKCGRKGCYEQYCSATAIERRATEALGKKTTVPELFWAHEAGEKKATQCLQAIALDFAIGMGTLVNLLEPQMIVLGGGAFSTGGGPLIEMIKEHLPGQAFPSSLAGLKIEASKLRGNSGVLGAAALAFQAVK